MARAEAEVEGFNLGVEDGAFDVEDEGVGLVFGVVEEEVSAVGPLSFSWGDEYLSPPSELYILYG